MTDEELFWRPRRLLLALLEDADSMLVCAQTVTMARAFETEVSGVLVEENAIFELAALTVCTEVGAVTRRFQQLDPEGRRSEEHTSELQSRGHLGCRLLLENK